MINNSSQSNDTVAYVQPYKNLCTSVSSQGANLDPTSNGQSIGLAALKTPPPVPSFDPVLEAKVANIMSFIKKIPAKPPKFQEKEDDLKEQCMAYDIPYQQPGFTETVKARRLRHLMLSESILKKQCVLSMWNLLQQVSQL